MQIYFSSLPLNSNALEKKMTKQRPNQIQAGKLAKPCESPWQLSQRDITHDNARKQIHHRGNYWSRDNQK